MKYSEELVDQFIEYSRYESYHGICEKLLKTGRNALMKQPGWGEDYSSEIEDLMRLDA